MSKRLTVVYQVPDDYDVTRITGTGELEVVSCEWTDAITQLATARELLREACEAWTIRQQIAGDWIRRAKKEVGSE